MNLQHKPAVVVYCHAFDNNDPISDDYYWQAYQELVLAIKSFGAEAYFVFDENSYQGHGQFEVAYTINQLTDMNSIIECRDIRADLVFNRTDFKWNDIPTINDPYMHHVGTDKIATYEHFAALQPKSIACNSLDDIRKAFDSITGERIVVKAPVSHGGRDVVIGSKHDVINNLPDMYPLLVQQFLDTSDGIKGHVDGVHDLRMAICGGRIISCFIRKAMSGSYHSNVARGGELSYVEISKIPKEPLMIARQVDKHFSAYPRYYSVDCVNTSAGWKLIEINSLIGLEASTDGPHAVQSTKKLSRYLASTAKSLHNESLVASAVSDV